MKNFFSISLLLACFNFVFANNSTSITGTIEWDEDLKTYSIDKNRSIFVHSFKNAVYNDRYPTMPIYQAKFPLTSYGSLSATFVDAKYEPLNSDKGIDDQFITNNIEIETAVNINNKRVNGGISFIPIRKNSATGFYERLISFEILIRNNPSPLQTTRSGPTTFDSALKIGELYKIAIDETGIHKLDYNFLKNTLGIAVENINPKQIKIFGNGGGNLPESNATSRIDDLEENTIFIRGENDGSFDTDDYILFYAEGAHIWNYLGDAATYAHEQNLYDNKNYYFLRINDGVNTSKRIQNQSSVSSTAYSTSTFDDYLHHEVDEINLLDDNISGQGSGKDWFGPSFKFTTTRDYNFQFPNLVTTEPVTIKTRTTGRAIGGGTHQFKISANNSLVYTQPHSPVSGSIENTYSDIRTNSTNFNVNTDNIDITMEYVKPNSTAEGWVDYITLISRRKLTFGTTPLAFRDKRTLDHASASYTINGMNSNVLVWDITDPLNPKSQDGNLSGSNFSFGKTVNELHQFIAFEHGQAKEPEFIAKINNQNLHGLSNPDLLIIYHKDIAAAASRLADHRRSVSGMEVHAIDVDLIYNEFGSGRPDITAIRDFAKMFYDRGTPGDRLKYLLLFGDASFDYKNNNENPDNFNLVPTYETAQSNNGISAHPSDDYFGLLDVTEGGGIISGDLDIAIGRLPVRNLTEGDLMVDKIIHYETSPLCLGDWKNRILFNADDEDSNIHFRDADGIAETVRNNYNVFNLQKVYFDAFNQVTTPGGNRYPAVNEAINQNIGFKGDLVVNYMGHGGINSWAQERVLTIDDIDAWDNYNKMPLFVTATCTFGPYDEPKITSAGELLMLKPDGGAIGLFTTVRAVYASTNQQLTKAVFEYIFEPVGNKIPTIGEILRLSKNSLATVSGKENSRKFTLLGDPSLTLIHPKYNIITTQIDNQPISSSDTIRALQEVTIKGYIEDIGGGVLTDFNGTIAPTVYDKLQNIKMLVNDPNSRLDSFNLQKNIIFKGLAGVNNGEFQFTFVVPSDIDYEFGNGKISYYADDGVSRDAAGYHDDIIIGGTDPNGIADDEGPKVEIFMNNEDFVFGGLTDENPVLFVKLSDDVGINTVGTGIGHDITGILDENNQEIFVLNDFYESALDDPKKGEVRYPLNNLEEGRHSIKVKAWDISNNSGEDYTEFVVAKSAELAINMILNYPNPFTTSTNFQFEHNLPTNELTVQIQIYTVSGRLLKTISEQVTSEGYRVTDIGWDGTDDFGSRIGKGVYVYKVQIGAANGDEGMKVSNSEFEKLVILK